jgi:hypothetical protein
MIEYFVKTHDLDTAAMLMQGLDEVAPDAPATEKCRQLVARSFLLSLVSKATARFRRRR